ncbi:MAG: GAF domain-containing protein [Proteobacteria bacterium]|nr:GAF domain-containing protein [Pseudomonadota bacterium]
MNTGMKSELPPGFADELCKLTMACARSGGNPETLLDTALEILVAMNRKGLRHAGAIFLFDPQQEKLLLVAHRGHPKIVAACSQSLSPGQCLCGAAAVEGRVLYSPRASRESWHLPHTPDGREHGDLCIPLFSSQEDPVGAIHLVTEPDMKPDPSFLNFLDKVGRILGAFLSESIRMRSMEDYIQDLLADILHKEKRISELSMALEHAKRAKSDFLASMSHELRTPLNAVIGFSQVLQEDYFGDLNEKQKQYVADILDSGKHLLALINDILDLSRVEAGVMEMELALLRISRLFQSSLTMIREKAAKHGIHLEVDLPENVRDLEIVAEERKLKQVLFNLLSNAVKFTGDGGTIRLGARLIHDPLVPPDHVPDSGMETLGCVEIFVSDTGIGIEKEDQERIFDDFYQVRRGLSGKTPGTGLGLPLARRLVAVHGGRLWVESNGKNQGCRFALVLPVGACVIPAASAASRKRGKSSVRHG